MPPKKVITKRKGTAGGKPAGGEGPTPAAVLAAFEAALQQETITPDPLPAGAKRDEFKDTRRMKRLRRLPVLRHLDPKDTTLLRNDRPSYRESNSGYMRGEVMAPREECIPCKGRDGSQRHCVTVHGEFNGSCTNCAYDADGKKCSFWRAGKGSKGQRRKCEELSEEIVDSDNHVDSGRGVDSEDDEEDDEEVQDGPSYWEGDRDGDDDGVGGDDGDAGALFVPHAIVA